MDFAVSIIEFEETYRQILNDANVTDSPPFRFTYSKSVLEKLGHLAFEDAVQKSLFQTYVDQQKQAAYLRCLLGSHPTTSEDPS